MRRRHLLDPSASMLATLAACLAAGSGLVLGASAPAGADETAASPASVTLEGGGLTISAPSSPKSLGTGTTREGTVTISGQLGQVQVIDSRGAPKGSGWTATATSTAFTPASGPAIAASAVSYTAGPITRTGIATYTANDPGTLSGASPVVTATAITGDNTATWNPTIHIAVAAQMPAGVYSGTITHSVS